MNHKEKAKALVEKYTQSIFETGYTVTKPMVKQCALIAVDFALSIGVSPMDTKELQQIRKEIEQL